LKAAGGATAGLFVRPEWERDIDLRRRPGEIGGDSDIGLRRNDYGLIGPRSDEESDNIASNHNNA
jgi:hypothetical protein